MDLQIIETFDGGDFVKTGKDIALIDGFQNMPYLGMFGGNPGNPTPLKRLETEQAFDWWGNSLLMQQEPGMQFNSETEHALNTVPITSAGRTLIEQAVRNDLKFMKTFAKVSIAVSIVGVDRILIGVRIQEPDNIQQREQIYIWDATRKELNLKGAKSTSGAAPSEFGFDYILDFVLL
jgi:hypothetical protein